MITGGRPYLRSGEDVRRDWVRINEVDADGRRLAQELAAVRAEVADLRRRLAGLDVMHPFKLYRVPDRMRGAVDADGWRKFRVRAGVLLMDDANGIVPTGCDVSESDPDNPVAVEGTEITCPADADQYWVWIELSQATGSWSAALKHSATPADDGWTTYPLLDENKVVPIGWLDAVTKAASKVCVVRQLLRSDWSPGGAGVSRFKLKSVQGDYVTARTWDGTTEGSTDVYIAKPWRLRESYTTIAPAIGEPGYLYTYGAGINLLNRKRTKTSNPGGVAEYQLVTPIWLVDEVITAVSCTTGVETEGATPEPVTLLLVSDSRAWAKQTDT